MRGAGDGEIYARAGEPLLLGDGLDATEAPLPETSVTDIEPLHPLAGGKLLDAAETVFRVIQLLLP